MSLFNGIKWPYATMQQLNLDWILSKIKNLTQFLPDNGSAGQILRRTADGAEWSNEHVVGDVTSVNGMRGDVVLGAGLTPLTGKKVGFWGDSLQYGLLSDSSQSAQNYPTVFGQLTGADVENNAISGSSITNHEANSFINIYQTIDWTQYDYVVLAFGANDVGHGETIANITSAFDTVVEYIMTHNPNVKMALCSPTYGTNLAGRYPPSNICLQDIYYIVRDCAHNHNITFVDFLRGASINQYNISVLAWDGLHYNDAGYYKLGEFLARTLLVDPIHEGVGFGSKAQKVQFNDYGTGNGVNIYFYGNDGTIYSLVAYNNALQFAFNDGNSWSTLWTMNP